MLIAGDIGGTKTKLAVFPSQGDPRDPIVKATYPSKEFPNLEAILKLFLRDNNISVDNACFGVAGPVVGDRARVTNLPWFIESTNLKNTFNFKRVMLMNDLVSIANAVPILEDRDLFCINQGSAAEEGTIAVIGPGTGLGEAFLTWDGHQYRAYPSEGGHTDFAPKSPVEIQLLQYLQARFSHVSYERICSGSGIPNIYAFFKDTGLYEEPAWLTEQLSHVKDAVPVIARAALAGEPPCELCTATMDVFVRILGAEAGNMALKVLSTGGVFLGGGIPPKILPKLEDGKFMDAFVQKGRFKDLLSKMPVCVILNDEAALLGVANYSLRQPYVEANR